MDSLYDVIIIGGGPAGLTAALYLARARYRVLVLEAEAFGGQITITEEVVNYPGVFHTSGKELTETMRKQAQAFGAEFMLARAEKLELDQDVKVVHTSRGQLRCFGVLLATGSHPRQLGFKGESDFRGRGVAYCATCDGEFFTGKEVFVIGGGFAAAEESVFLTKYASHVTILIRGDDFSCAQATAEAAKNHEKITILTNTVVDEVSGDTALRTIRYHNTKTGEGTVYTKTDDTFGVFVFAGYEPATALVSGVVALDEQGYIITDRNQKTSVEGVYAAGDVCIKALRQVVTAVGDGALAATELERYAAAMQKKTGLLPTPPVAEKQPAQQAPAASAAPTAPSGSFFSGDILAQLNTVFSRMGAPLVLRLYLDERPVSAELRQYMDEMAALTDKLTVEIATDAAEYMPCVKVIRADGTESGLAFHGVPGGHAFTSIVLGLYNAAGPGQAIDPAVAAQIAAISKPVDIKILVSLSCTMCPELVTAAQRIAAASANVTAEVFDINHFEALKDQYKVMSVPCMVVNDDKVHFGKKNIQQLLDIIGN